MFQFFFHSFFVSYQMLVKASECMNCVGTHTHDSIKSSIQFMLNDRLSNKLYTIITYFIVDVLIDRTR